ncbi:MAG: glycerol-3-phosphate dehydrogenase/oxidase, partial [Smithellaceae bacterium]|nr:glycerol-3-phosphate dehydrogenase/oxidase [Smithellaceae bacterium]
MRRFIDDYKGGKFDVVVVGGGITGASIAYEAATRGFSVALLEKSDFSGATSAATSKMIHGGVRYLANGEFGLVRESLKERKVLEDIAPNFIYPFPIVMTHNEHHLKNNKWLVKIGLMIYDCLSYDRNRVWDKSKRIPRHKTISAKKALQMQPQIRKDGLTGASIFHDCVSLFPERLTLTFVKSAVANGAQAANYAKVEGFVHGAAGKIAGVKVKDLLTGKTHEIKGDVVINCGGPWADIVLGLAKEGKADHQLRRSEGIHIITKKKLVNEGSMIGSMTPAGRHFFVIPWRGHSLIGTTDKPYVGSPDDYRVTKQSIQELIDEVNASHGDGTLSMAD